MFLGVPETIVGSLLCRCVVVLVLFSVNLVPRVFVPYCACWLDETPFPYRWSRETKTLGTRVVQCLFNLLCDVVW